MIEELARLIHEEWCCDTPECRRWAGKPPSHREYYERMAQTLHDKLRGKVREEDMAYVVLAVLEEAG